ncbi:hypothetical protein WJX84_009672 [Apatococcus fuscideae]|uniref:Uncharacterized protein n=1 Tax=Apatococcus fuscideae TaxID=2026836 RepID=A0AAW1T3W2_9CHLO
MNVNGIVEEHEWQSGLYDCCSGWDSTTLCLQAWLAPCWMFGDNMNLLRSDGCCGPCCLCCHFPCCGQCYAATSRRQIRHKYGIKEGPCSDKQVWAFCWCCATCQEAKELQTHEVSKKAPQYAAEATATTMPPTTQAMDCKREAAKIPASSLQTNDVKPKY